VTDESDPPRLRSLAAQLPRTLANALESVPDEEVTAEQLDTLAARVRTAIASSERPAGRAVVRRKRAALGSSFALVMTFALGAGAGVVVSAGWFLAQRRHDAELTRPAAGTAGTRPPVVRRDGPRASSRPAAVVDLPAVTPPAPAPPSMVAPPREPARPRGSSSAAPDSLALASSSDAGLDELGLLARAQAALGTDPGHALALSGDHERIFTRGALAQEREVIVIDALLRLGRTAEASARAARFHQQFPGSVHGRRVDVLLGREGASGVDHN